MSTSPTPPTSPANKIGIFGGTFDPPHLGHLILAESACDALDLSLVLFVPVGVQPLKQNNPVTPVEHRVAMLQAAIAGNARFAISDVDITRPGPHYTTDTLTILRLRHPDAELYFLMGGDSLRDFTKWHDPEGIITQARLAVMRRPGSNVDLSHLAEDLPAIVDRVTFVDAPEIGISATTIRERLKLNHSIRYQVPDAVERYVNELNLYR